MLQHLAPTFSASRFGFPSAAASANYEVCTYRKDVGHLTSPLRNRSGSRTTSTRRRSCRVAVSQQDYSSIAKDLQPSLGLDSGAKQENLLLREGDDHISSGAGSLRSTEHLVEESQGVGGDEEAFEEGDSAEEYIGAQALSLSLEEEAGGDLGKGDIRKDGRNYRSCSPEVSGSDDAKVAVDGGEGISQDVDFRTLVSAMGLIMGTAVGPGILGLPAATLPAGIQASTLMIIGAWAYVTSSILLVAESSCALMAQRGEKEVSFTGLVEHTLGYRGARVVALVYASLNYALLVACVAGLGSILHGWLPMPAGLWSAGSAAIVGGLVAFAPFKILDGFNRALCALMLTAITSLVAIGVFAGKGLVTNYGFSPSFSYASVLSAVPVTVLTLGFHVITPVVCRVMKGRPQETRKAILLGGAVPLAMVLAWNSVVLSLAGPNRSSALDPIKLLLSLNQSAAPAVQAFAFAALGTTLIGYSVSFPKQLADTVQIFSKGARPEEEFESRKKEQDDGDRFFAQTQPLLWALCPPTVAAVLWPTAFASALDFAGVYANCFLFGVLPPVMTWIYRSQRNTEANMSSEKDQLLVPGGNLFLSVLFVISILLGVRRRI